MNIRSQIGWLVTAIYVEVHYPRTKTDKYLVKRWENELQALINAPTIEFTALPELPHPCPPAELYPDMTDEEFELYEKKRIAEGRLR